MQTFPSNVSSRPANRKGACQSLYSMFNHVYINMSELKSTISEQIMLSSKGYKLQKLLGEGTYAKVYLTEFSAKDDTHKTSLACKIIETSKAPRDYVLKFVPREIDVLGRLHHPHLIHVHGIFQRKTKYYIFMRFTENGDLFGYILKNGCVSENQSRVWFRQLALGLQYLHELHIAHRDIKCENVLLTANFNVKLSDFGFARFCIDETNANILSETYCGSMSYAAPEIICGKPYLPKPTDLWSLGVVLFVMLNKSMPFDDKRMGNLYEQQMGKKYRFRSRVGSTVSLKCKSILKDLLEPDPGLRHSVHQVLCSDWIAMDSRLTKRPELMSMFKEARQAIEKYLKKDDSFVWVTMLRGHVTLPVFQSLESYWLLAWSVSLVGESDTAMRIIHNYHRVKRQYGFTLEVYNLGTGEVSSLTECYPLRAELIDSIMYLYRETRDPKTVANVGRYPQEYTAFGVDTLQLCYEDRMESFFLAETTKYPYLLFDPDNFIHNPGVHGTIINTPNGECLVDIGGYLFNTEAHPIDPTMLYCFHETRQGINISEVHRMYQILEVEDNIKFMTIIEGTIKDHALIETVETPQERGLNISEDVKTDTAEKIDQNPVLI